MKKLISILLCIVLTMGLMACGGSNNQTSTAGGKATEKSTAAQGTEAQPQTGESGGGGSAASGIDFNEDPYTLNVCYAVLGEAQPDLAMIEEKLNEITLKEINAKVKLEAVSLFSMANVYALKASGQEKVDLMLLFPGSTYLTSFANSNLIRPIEAYMDQWGADLKAGLGSMLEAGQYKGHQYAIPQNRDVRKNGNGFNLSKDLCAKYDIDPKSITTIEALEAAFETIKENEPEVTVLMPETSGGGIAIALADYYDTCGTGGGILEVQEDGKLKIVNQVETESYKNACLKVREWYEKGYISKDVLTTQDSGSTMLPAGKCFAVAATSINPNMGDKYSIAVVINKDKPLLTTTDDQLILWAVASSCERPDKAVQFINLCFTSEEITNLTMYGVSDVHYTKLENGAINTANNANWQNFWPMFGDYGKQYVVDANMEVMGVQTVEEYKKTMAAWELETSPAYGFNFDPANVKTQIAACDAVNNEFMLPIANGTVDVDGEMEKWAKKLDEAGLGDVMEEKQAQLDEWVASKQ